MSSNIFKCAKCGKTEPRKPNLYPLKGANDTELCCNCAESVCSKCQKPVGKHEFSVERGWAVYYCKGCVKSQHETEKEKTREIPESPKKETPPNSQGDLCTLKGCGKIITAKNGEGFVCIDCGKKFCSYECRTQAPKCEPQLAREQNNEFQNAIFNSHAGNVHAPHVEYNNEIEMHRQSLREFQAKKHHMELRLVEEENDWHGPCDYKNGWSKEKQIASIKKSIAGWETKIQYEKDWLAKNGNEQDRQIYQGTEKEQNNLKSSNETININSLVEYFKSQNIKEISLTPEGNLRIEYYGNYSHAITVEPVNNSELQEVKNYLQKNNKNSLSQRELNSLPNTNSASPEKPKNNSALWIGGLGVALVIGVIVGLLVKRKRKKV